MKFDFKKMTSVLASAVMLGSTMGFAAAATAATYPAPFVDGGASDVAIVVGSVAANSDMLAAIDISSNLATGLAGSVVTTTAPPTGGDSVLFEKSSTKFQLGKSLWDVVATSVTDTSPGNGLPTLLADGKFEDDDHDEFEYSQKIDMANLNVTMFESGDYKEDEPTVGVKISNNDYILNYSLEFSTDPEWADLATATLPLLGKEYYILSATNSSQTMELLDAADSTSLNDGETTTLTVNGKVYTVGFSFIGSSGVKLTVDCQDSPTGLLAATKTQKICSGTDKEAYIGVKEVNVNDYAGGIKTAEFAIGSGKLKLVNNSNIEINDESINNLKVNFYTSASKLDKLVINWKANDDLFIAPDSSPVMPGFEAVKLAFTGMEYPVEEEIKIIAGSDSYIQLDNFPLKDSVEDISILYAANTSVYNSTGKDEDNMLLSSINSTIDFDGNIHDYFVASFNDGNDAESYLMRVNGFTTTSSINYTNVQYKKDGEWVTIQSKAKDDDTITIGNVEIVLDGIATNQETLNITSGTNVNFYQLYSKEGMRVYLPYLNTSDFLGADGQNGQIGVISTDYVDTGNATNTFNLVFQEEDKDGAIGAGNSINLTLGFNSASTPQVSVTDIVGEDATLEEIQSTDVFRSFAYSALATEILWDKSGDQYKVTLKYHGGEAEGKLHLASPDTSFGEGSGNIVPITDAEASGVGKNMIVVGGSCINTVAAELLGGSLCEAEFQTKTGVGAGEYLIETFKSPYASKVATLVAGYNAIDTTNAANALTTGTIEIAEGTKYTGTTASDAAVVA